MRLTSYDTPLLLYFDDIQWASSAALAPLVALLREAPKVPIALIATTRPEAMEPAHAASELVTLCTTHIRLGPLTLQGVRNTLVSRLDQTESDVTYLAKVVFEKSGGNPLHLGTVVEELIALDVLRPSHDGWAWDLEQVQSAAPSLPVAELLAARVASLPPALGEVLSVAAHLGARTPLHLLARALDCSLAHLLTNVETLKTFAHVREAGLSLCP